MSTLALELGAELEALHPEDARHIQRALREMLQLVKSKSARQTAPRQPYVTEARPLGIKVGNSHKWTDWLDEAKGSGWK